MRAYILDTDWAHDAYPDETDLGIGEEEWLALQIRVGDDLHKLLLLGCLVVVAIVVTTAVCSYRDGGDKFHASAGFEIR